LRPCRAAEKGHAALAETLLAAGARPSQGNKYACTPLHAAAAGGHAHVAHALLAAGAEPEARDSVRCRVDCA
jgi:ankyrin repeat protein